MEKKNMSVKHEMKAWLAFCCAGHIHGWHQLLLSKQITTSYLWLRCFSSVMTDLTPHLSVTDRHMSVASIPPPSSLLTPCRHKSESRSLPLSLPHAPMSGPPALDAAPGPEEELQSSAVLWGGGLWGGLSWAASGPGPERSQHAQRTGACMHLSTQGLRWEPAGCT